MPGRMTRSAPQSPFELPEVRAVVRATRLSRQNAGKAQKIHAGSGFIWRISVELSPNRVPHAPFRCLPLRLCCYTSVTGLNSQIVI
jgi:hypothetical protein